MSSIPATFERLPDLGSSHVAFANYLKIKAELSPIQRREALLGVWTGQPGCELRYRRRWLRELSKVAPLVDDADAFAALPAEIEVFRGQGRDDGPGLSWTTNRETALFFARSCPHPIGGSYRPERPVADRVLLTGTVKKADVLLFSTGRKEFEIVASAVLFRSKEAV